MRTYSTAGTWSELKGLDPTTNEDTAAIVITVSTEDAVDPHYAIGLFLDCVVDVVEKIHSKAHPDDIGTHEFPIRETLDRILTIRGR